MNLRESLGTRLTEEEHEHLRTSFDTVGDIAITEIPEQLQGKQELIAEHILKLNKHINVVVKKASEHEGELRIQHYKHIGGENRFETTVKENGIELFLDINKTYYSIRSQNERLRIIEQVTPDERVLVMFSGIGPFTIGIAKNTSAQEVIGVELNEDASKYAQLNVQRNNAFTAQEICGNVKTIVPELGVFDRIIMPLPHTAYEFLDLARSVAEENAIIHLYCFETPEKIDSFAQSLLKENEKLLKIKKAGTYNPAVYRWSVDMQTHIVK